MECQYCKSTKIVEGIKVGKSNEAGVTGLKYKAAIFVGTEGFLADLCQDCGSVIRFYVKNTKRRWARK